MNKVEIETPDGRAPTYVWDNAGPSVLFYIDGIGMRPAIRDVGERIAAQGYRVVMPDLFYRLGEYTAPDPKDMFSKPEVMKAWFGKVMPIATPENFLKDIGAYLAWIGAPQVACTGYCMGGRLSIVTAEAFPDRVAAAAAFHPGGLVTDKPDSPHLHVASITAKILVAAAKEDQNMTPEQQRTLDDALTQANVEHQVIQFDAKHGWVPSDTPVYDAVQAERHYEALFALLSSAF
ncbi:MAG: dienelactone hydrolase family protein [Kofleriaceae bacterium]